MPKINLGRIVSDPEFSENCTRTRRANTVNQYGESTTTNTTLDFIATVTINTGRGINRTRDATQSTEAILVSTQTELYTARDGYQPDIVTYKGKDYIVTDVEDYSSFGFIEANCLLRATGGV